MLAVGNKNKKQMIRFFIVGIACVAVDFTSYFGMLIIEIDYFFAKGLSFILGALLGYFVNRSYTFQSTKKGPTTFVYFSFLYLVTFIVNVGLNKLIIGLLMNYQLNFIIAFITATIASTILNFLGMKAIVFKN